MYIIESRGDSRSLMAYSTAGFTTDYERSSPARRGFEGRADAESEFNGGVNGSHLLWEYELCAPPRPCANFGRDIFSTPVVGLEGAIYAGDGLGTVHAVRNNGTEQWVYETGGPVRTVAFTGVSVLAGSADGKVYVLDAETGERTMSFDAGSELTTQPLTTAGNVIVGSRDGRLHAFAPPIPKTTGTNSSSRRTPMP